MHTEVETDVELVAPARALEDGWTLPASWYTDRGAAALERRRIFERSWQYAGPAAHAAEPASYFTTQTAHLPVVVVRDRDGVLRAFVNVCRHRGHLVASGSGCRETLQCRYHAWTYELDGSLRRAPRSDREPGFDPAELSLRPVAVDTWGPFVFVNADVDAAPLAETLGDLPDLVSGCRLDVDELRFHSHHEWEIRSNWKVAIENYLECYHCPVAHPGFSKVIDVDPDAYRLRVEGAVSSQFGALRESGRGLLPEGAIAQAQYHLVWPCTTINIDPGVPNLSIERWVPTSVGATMEVTDCFFGPDVTEAQAQELIEFGTQVGEEDLELCEAVQRGLESGAVEQGRLMLRSETLIHAFQRRVADALAG